MKRSYLKLGDKSSAGGVVAEGIPLMMHDGTELTFLGAVVVCPACRSTGVIAEKGPRWPDQLMGRRPALEGDICACKCYPPPVMIASQTDMTMSFESKELVSMGFSFNGSLLEAESTSEHWIRFALNDAGSCDGLRCRAHFADGSVEEGIFGFDDTVHFDRSNASTCQKIDVVLDDAQTSGQSVVGSILMAMVG
ncbi:PAAR domain-containing protein [Paraburkholderia terricola]|uniref:PAAR motif-containing protein n=1 Tax=Paraburkholderia terricola TaxID=169427 RepID=A0A1M6NKF6_9BURK|nr:MULTISPECIES: PAAR domain-containing protein [Paraburkholderia]SDO15580.1 PAAR motif-containing protein [Paraburkholderia sediminicola]SHJ96179.1 PAAR motif-containing protein [Paraburkholderia terricola]